MGLIVLVWIVAIAIIGVCGFGAFNYRPPSSEKKKEKAVRFSLAGLGAIALVAGLLATVPLTQTESFKRFQKSIDSEFKGGITREVVVYSEGGEEIYREQGQFDVEHSNDRLKWVDENGRVQIVYLGRSSTAIVNEIGEEEDLKGDVE